MIRPSSNFGGRTALALLLLWSGCASALECFADLSRIATEGTDFVIEVLDRGAPVTILAIHGGTIEPFTTDLARLVAGSDHNFYSFTGLIEGQRRAFDKLHLPSSRFDEASAVELARRSEQSISIHGFGDRDTKQISIGGLNPALGAKIAAELTQQFPEITVCQPCARFPGKLPLNIVNRSRKGGAQLELSEKLTDELGGNPAYAKRLAEAIRAAILRP